MVSFLNDLNVLEGDRFSCLDLFLKQIVMIGSRIQNSNRRISNFLRISRILHDFDHPSALAENNVYQIRSLFLPSEFGFFFVYVNRCLYQLRQNQKLWLTSPKCRRF